MAEHQNIEYKETWRDDYLKWIFGFANAHGGKIYIGIDDNGNITGVADYKKLLEDIPNKVVSHLGLTIDAGLPEPLIEEHLDGVIITFLKDIYSEEYLRTLDLNDRQVKAVLYVKEKNSIKNSEYQLLNIVGKTLSIKELQDLVDKNIFQKIGTTGRSTKYVLLNDR